MTEAGLREAVNRFLLDGGDYFAVWPAYKAAIFIKGRFISKHISDLWLPASDDIVVLDADERIVFAIDHEERMLLP